MSISTPPPPPTLRPGADLYTLHEAAEKIGVCYATMRRYTSRGDLPVVRIGPRFLRIRHTDLQAFIDSRVDLGRTAA